MPAIFNPHGAIFNEGYMFAKPDGESEYNVPFGQLQEVSVNDTFGLRELEGNTSLAAIAVGASDRRITISWKHAVFRARQIGELFGATVTTDPGPPETTTIESELLDRPILFDLQLKSPSDGSDYEWVFYGCIANGFKFDSKLRDFIIPDMEAMCYGDGTKFWTLILPGDQTTS